MVHNMDSSYSLDMSNRLVNTAGRQNNKIPRREIRPSKGYQKDVKSTLPHRIRIKSAVHSGRWFRKGSYNLSKIFLFPVKTELKTG